MPPCPAASLDTCSVIGPKEKRYAPQTSRNATGIHAQLRFCRARGYSRVMAAMQTGSSSMAENLERIASARPSPKRTARRRLPCSSHNVYVNSAVTIPAPIAISMVARPACANTAGVLVNRKTGASAPQSPSSLRPHSHTTVQASRKNGRIPSLASVSALPYRGALLSTALPSCQRSGRFCARAPYR